MEKFTISVEVNLELERVYSILLSLWQTHLSFIVATEEGACGDHPKRGYFCINCEPGEAM